MSAAGCVHRWRVAEANGPTSEAVCRSCGARRELPNAFAGDREGGWADMNDEAYAAKLRRGAQKGRDQVRARKAVTA